MPVKTAKQLRTLAAKRDSRINKLIEKLEKTVGDAQQRLFDEISTRVVDQLEYDTDGTIKNTTRNRNALQRVDTVFSQWQNSDGMEILATTISGVKQVLSFQYDYYQAVAPGNAQLVPLRAQAVDYVNKWLGLEPSGTSNGQVTYTVGENGYLQTVLKGHNTMASRVKDSIIRGVVGQQGWQKTKTAVRDLLDGSNTYARDNPTQGIKINQYFRNLVYDTYSVLDRTTAQTYATGLGFQFAIFEGGIMKRTRTFCREHNGKVYHKTEIADMLPDEAIPDNYDPFIDMGGYGCRHHWNWIPDSLAFVMRPSARKFVKAA
jgi:hypothetical protein